MATFRKRRSKSGQISHQVQIRRVGYKPLSDTFSTLAEAQRWARDQESKLDKGQTEDVGALRKTSVAQLLERFLKEKVPGRKGQREETARITFLLQADFAARRLDQDVAGALQAWIRARSTEVSPATIARDLSLLSSIFTTATKEWRIPISVNPVSLVKRPVINQPAPRRLWTPEDFARLKDAAAKVRYESEPGAVEEHPLPVTAREYVLPALELSIETAMRRGELCSIDVGNICLDERRLWLAQTKTGVGRNVPLSTRAVEIVKELLQVPRPSGEIRLIPVNPDTLGLRFRQLRDAAGLQGLRLHDGRHTAATNASKVLHNLLELSAFTGHRSLQTLKKYYHPNATELAERLG